jgi:hypothetical protein
MLVSPGLAIGIMVGSLAALASPARADPPAVLVTCQAMVDRAAQTAGAPGDQQDDAELRRCRQVVRDWTLRESRMSVDEHGRPLR